MITDDNIIKCNRNATFANSIYLTNIIKSGLYKWKFKIIQTTESHVFVMDIGIWNIKLFKPTPYLLITLSSGSSDSMDLDIASIPIIAFEAGFKKSTRSSPSKVLPVSLRMTEEYRFLSFLTKKIFCEKDLEVTATVSFVFNYSSI